MRVIETPSDWIKIREGLAGRIGFVPTMGALHDGHATLLRRSREENDVSILSIYVNETQFDNKSDLARYPKTFEGDLAVARREGVDLVFHPKYADMYPDDYRYKVTESSFSRELCGAHRPGHFDGVLTVVMKLLNLVRADRAYFGEKDHQQLQLVKGMVDAFFMTTEIVACPTVREVDGLALSSRNVNLTSAEREIAPLLKRTLSEATSADEARTKLNGNGFVVDYVEDIGGRRYAAAQLGKVRLIDNVER